MLDRDELERYARHIVLRDVGGPGQQKIKAARVLCVGAGGLGSAIIQYLAAAGVGTIGIVDDDVVSLSNLQRQVIHGTPDIGRAKVSSAADAVRRLNPHVAVETHAVRLDATNAAELVQPYDIVVDGLDNFPARFALADTCYAVRRPLVSAGVLEFYGSLTTLMPYLTGADGEPNPSLRCMTRVPADGAAVTCVQVGILGSVAGVLGTLAATEVLKLITGVGEPLVRRLLMVDLRDMGFDIVDYRRDPNTVAPLWL
jgi:molybdopterin-synthase adenylyltransferase